MSTVVIVGAGISGLAAAFRLQQRLPDATIQILEAGDRPGGTTWTLREGGFQVEMGPNGFLDTKPTMLQLCRDVGLGDRLIAGSDAARKNRYLFLGDRLRALPGGLVSFLRTDLLSWRGKLSLLMENFRGRGVGDDESIDAFARRRAGNEAADTFADALVTGIYAGDPTLLSLPACFPRVAALEQQYGSVMKGFKREATKRRQDAAFAGQPYERPGKMWSFAGGLRVLIEALTAQLKSPPVYNVAVRAVEKRESTPRWVVRADGQDAWHADAVILTCPAYRQSGIVSELDADLARLIDAIPYNRIVVAALGYRRADVPGSLDGFGFIAPQRTRRDLLGVQWCSSIYQQRAPDDAVLLRAMCGGWHRPEIVDWDDTRLLAALRSELQLAMGITAEPMFHRIVRWPKAIPQYHVGHLARVAEIDARRQRHPRLYLGGNAYHGVALNDCAEQGERIAEQVARDLHR